MDVWELWVILLLLLPAYNNSQVTDVKTTGREPYVAPICTNETMNIITLITCKINTEAIKGPECILTYHIEHGFKRGCDSRFRLMKENQTIFFQLTSLTPEDSGNYSCDCVQPEGTITFHLNITVKEDEEVSSSMLPISTSLAVGISCGVTALIVVIGVVLGFILRKIHCRNCSRTDTSGLPVCETPRLLKHNHPDDLYINLQCQTNDTQSVHSQRDGRTKSARETDTSNHIYDNI